MTERDRILKELEELRSYLVYKSNVYTAVAEAGVDPVGTTHSVYDVENAVDLAYETRGIEV